MAFTDEEKVAIRHHLGFLNVTAAATFALGTPASTETQFIIEAAFDKVLPAAEPRVRQLLGRLEATEEQMFCGQDSYEVNQLDEIHLNHQGRDRVQIQMARAYIHWANSLANLLGVYRNPFDKRFAEFGLKGPNLTVQH